MARILMAGNFNHKIPGGFYYNVDNKLRNGFIRAGHCVMEFSDRDQARLSNIFANRKFGVRGANEKFLAATKNFQPDLILLGHANIIRNDTLDEIRTQIKKIRIAMFNVDSLALDSHQDNVKAIHSRKMAIDAMFITTGIGLLRQFKTDRNWVGYFPNPVDASIETGRVFEQNNLSADLVYCVGGIRDGDERLELARNLLSALPDVRMEFHGLLGHANRWGAAYAQTLARARMGLNYSRPNNIPLYSSDRMAHLLGHGLMVLTASANEFNNFFTNEEMVFYNDRQDLIEKIRHYKNHDDAARKIARCGWEKAHQEFNEILVAKYIYERAMELPLSHAYVWQDQFVS